MGLAARIAALPNDSRRAAFCLRWAEDLRHEYDQGKRECIEDQKKRFRKMHRGREPFGVNLINCIADGEAVWSKSATCKSILSDQATFERWANLYNTNVTRKALEGIR